jgi:hypothetical protein
MRPQGKREWAGASTRLNLSSSRPKSVKMDTLEEAIPLVVANLKRRHPKLCGTLGDEVIAARFGTFRRDHVMSLDPFAACICKGAGSADGG